MLSYSLGRSLSYTDDAELKKMIKHVESNDHKIHAVVEAIVTSKLFTTK